MKRFYLFLMALSISWSCINDKVPEQNVKTEAVEEKKEAEQEVIPIPQLTSGIEAQTQGMNFLIPQKPKQVVDPFVYSDKGYPKLAHGAKVFVIGIEEDFARVKTYTDDEGWIAVEALQPAEKTDSTKYFGRKKFGEISTALGVYNLDHVQLWNDIYTREKIEASCVKGEKVVILDETEEHVKVGTVNGKEGWCMKGFVKFL